MTKAQMIENHTKTANYQRELIREHKICVIKNEAVPTVHFDEGRVQYYVKCTDCAIYFPEEED